MQGRGNSSRLILLVETERPRSGCWHGLALLRAFFWVEDCILFSVSSCGRKTVRDRSEVPFIRELILFMRPLPCHNLGQNFNILYSLPPELTGKPLVSYVQLLRPQGLKPTRFLSPWNFPGQNTEVGCHFLPQGIFPTQGSNLHCKPILYHLSHRGSPIN